jgi:hypothetical protein
MTDMSVVAAISKWREARERSDRLTGGIAAAKQIGAVNAAAYDVAHAPTTSLADFIDKLRFARHDVVERGVTDRCVLVLLDNMIRDAARLAGAPPSDDDIAAADEQTQVDALRLMRLDHLTSDRPNNRAAQMTADARL